MNLIDDDCIQPSSEKIQEIETNVSSSEFTFTFIVTIIISVFLPGRSSVVQKLKNWVFRHKKVLTSFLVCIEVFIMNRESER
jgi:hypothetical protein